MCLRKIRLVGHQFWHRDGKTNNVWRLAVYVICFIWIISALVLFRHIHSLSGFRACWCKQNKLFDAPSTSRTKFTMLIHFSTDKNEYEQCYCIWITFEKQVKAGEDSVIFIVEVRGLTCVMKVVCTNSLAIDNLHELTEPVSSMTRDQSNGIPQTAR